MTNQTPAAFPAEMRNASSFVFGGHIGPQSKKSLEKHVQQIRDGPNAQWMLDILVDLPRYYGHVVEKIPAVADAMDGEKLLAHLESWFRHGSASKDPIALDAIIPDIWVGPLMIGIQLDTYWRYLELRFNKSDGESIEDLQAEILRQHQQPQSGSSGIEMVGFCAGMIAAVAVASAHNRQEFEQYGATAMRVGTMMASLVGACEIWDKNNGKSGSVSLATAWRTAKQGKDMVRLVTSLSPNAYISVLFDESRATVTTTERHAAKLVRQLRAAGVTAIPLPFKGQLHTPGHERERYTEALIDICHAMPELQFPDAARLALPTYLDHPEGKPVSGEEVDLIGMVLRSILATQLNWASTVAKLEPTTESVSLVAFGLDRPMPPSITRRYGSKLVQYDEITDQLPKRDPAAYQKSKSIEPASETKVVEQTQIPQQPSISTTKVEQNQDELVAIVGMSLKVAGADGLEEFTEMLKTGASQHQVITHERMVHDMLHRDNADADPKRKWYGNFMRDSDSFDHKFFKKSPRESIAMDPQGRLSLEAAYQAVEQSGYFNELASTTTSEHEKIKHIGCYVGLCSFEYEINIACHPPTAFTATGGLRSFIPGKVSHYFGWTGPAMTFDTACSSSTVALHNACKDVLSGEVRAALCGGVNVLTNLQWTQNLAAGSFISPSGQCKPFDTTADGYCRGDGIAYVFLKKLSTAIADGNTVLGTIRATGINQNLNSTPLFVPNVPSLSTLFKDVMRKAKVQPQDISLVECHGTGTPVGDPAEYESVRQAVAGPSRKDVVPIGSVKGHIGHTEGAAGLISLIKVVMMMRDSFIPPQASFNKMNPHIGSKPEDMMEVVTSLRTWEGDDKIALINNYGACGSNASVVVSHSAHKPAKTPMPSAARLPFWVSGFDARSIAAYSTTLSTYLKGHAGGESQADLADVSFNMKRQSNPALPQGMIFSCSSLSELQDKLSQAAWPLKNTAASIGIVPAKSERPVILCFGGQVSTFVGLDRVLYDNAAVLRYHLDECNAAITAHGLDSIYPHIFSCDPLDDVVKLQTALFAMQYASAKSWIDSGLKNKVVSVVGHSFGEITALCIAGVLSLEDSIKLIAGRAKLVKESWGPDPGAMIAIEADEPILQGILKEANSGPSPTASIACYNGPRSFTIAGSTQAIDEVARVLASKDRKAEGTKSKRLNVTNAFHSVLVQGLLASLGDVGKELTFNAPTIPVERATEHGDSAAVLDWNFVGSHMREPVFFNHAMQRLAKKHPHAVFLEAGSNSSVTVMASRALAQEVTNTPDALHFQSVSITNTKKGMDGLTDATVSLWKQGLRVSFWPHHAKQTAEYAQLILPPYQFEKNRHWLELKSPLATVKKAAEKLIAEASEEMLQNLGVTQSNRQQDDATSQEIISFVGFQKHPVRKDGSSKKTKLARFRINTSCDKYLRLFATHVIVKTAPICPATLEIDMAIEALFTLNSSWKAKGFAPVIRDMFSHSAICASTNQVRYIDLEATNKAETDWHFTIHSVGTTPGAVTEKNAEGRIQMCSPTDPATIQEYGRYQRGVTYEQCKNVLNLGPSDEGVEALQGRNVYKAFEEVCTFGPIYKSVKYAIGREGDSAGVVHRTHTGTTWLDTPRSDAFGQVAGIYVNLLNDLPASDMFVATGLEVYMRSPHIPILTDGKENGSGVWHVYNRHVRSSDKTFVADIFVFDGTSGVLAEVIMGLKYIRIPKATMSKILTRVTTDKSFLQTTAANVSSSASVPAVLHKAIEAVMPLVQPDTAAKPRRANKKSAKPAKPTAERDIVQEVCVVVANVSGLEVADMSLDGEMADMGIDSLMGMELAREVEHTFNCTLDHEEQMQATSLRQFVACVEHALERSGGVAQQGDADESDSATGGENDNMSSNQVSDSELDSAVTTPGEESDFSEKELKPEFLPKHATVSNPSASAKRILNRGDVGAREAEGVRLTKLHTEGWETADLQATANSIISPRTTGSVVVVTGASGSLGSHLVQALAERSDVAHVVCINRPVTNMGPSERQANALSSRGIKLSPEAQAKLRVFDTDTTKPQLGLSSQDYAWLAQHGTGIIHNAWPMSGTRPLKAYEPQIRVMRNLLDLAREMAVSTTPRQVDFQFVSSIGVTGFSEGSQILEEPMSMAAVMPSGYNEGKWVCERMLTQTLRSHPNLFRAAVVRPGQISGSTTTGVWNPVEHFCFLVKSAQTLKAWPQLQGILHWLPVDRSARTMVDILTMDSEIDTYGVYHIDNPVGQPWNEMSKTMASALDIPSKNIIPFGEWTQRVRQCKLSADENPAIRVIDFLEGHFERMACGGIVLDTEKSGEHSQTMANEGPVAAEVVRSYVRNWKSEGFLH